MGQERENQMLSAQEMRYRSAGSTEKAGTCPTAQR